MNSVEELSSGHYGGTPTAGRPVLDVCWFTYRTNKTTPLLSLMGMMNRTSREGVDVGFRLYGSSLVHEGRNKALIRLREQATHVLFVDDDMLCEEDAALRLLALDKPVVSALATNREPPLRMAVQEWNLQAQAYLKMDRIPAGPVTGNFALGAAFLMIRRDVIDHLITDYLAADDWMRQNDATFNRMLVRKQARERERARIADERKRLFTDEKDPYLRVFDFVVPDNQRQMSEDWSFSNKLRELGIQTTIDGSTTIGHLGDYPYGIWDLFLREDLQKAATPEGGGLDPMLYMPPQVRAQFEKYMAVA
ncbi:MAG: hypothetical protein GY906_22470 [bacterium]|nr:hypothetical protein [bacterium]